MCLSSGPYSDQISVKVLNLREPNLQFSSQNFPAYFKSSYAKRKGTVSTMLSNLFLAKSIERPVFKVYDFFFQICSDENSFVM